MRKTRTKRKTILQNNNKIEHKLSASPISDPLQTTCCLSVSLFLCLSACLLVCLFLATTTCALMIIKKPHNSICVRVGWTRHSVAPSSSSFAMILARVSCIASHLLNWTRTEKRGKGKESSLIWRSHRIESHRIKARRPDELRVIYWCAKLLSYSIGLGIAAKISLKWDLRSSSSYWTLLNKKQKVAIEQPIRSLFNTHKHSLTLTLTLPTDHLNSLDQKPASCQTTNNANNNNNNNTKL